MESSALNALIFISAMLVAAALLAKAARRRFPQAASLCFFLAGIGAHYGTLALALPLAREEPRRLGIGLALFFAAGLAPNPFKAGPPRFGRRAILSALAALAAALALSAALELLYGGGAEAFGRRALVLAAAALLANSQSIIEPLLALGAVIALSPSATAQARLLGFGITLAALPLMGRIKQRARAFRLELAALVSAALALFHAQLGLSPAAAGLSAGLLFSAAGAQERAQDTGARQLGLSASAFVAGYLSAGASPFSYPLAIALSAAALLLYSLAKGLIIGRRGPAALSGMQAYDSSSSADYGALGAGLGLGFIGGATALGYALAQGIASLLIQSPKAMRGGQAGAGRVIAAIGKRENIAGILAFARGLESPAEPVRAVCVAAAKGSAGQSPQEAEEALVRVVAAGAQAGIQVLPSLIIASSPADGLARAALERGADALILGWPSMDPAGEADRPTLEQLAAATRVGLFIVRNIEKAASSRRIVHCFASGTEKAPGFYPCVEAIQRSCGKPAQAQFYAIGAAEAFKLVSPDQRFSARAEALDGWRAFINTLKAMGQPKPLIVIVAARQGTPAWSPLSERLAIAVYESLPDAPVVFAYTAESENAAQQETQAPALEQERSEPPAEPGDWPGLIEAARTGGRTFTAMGQAALVDAISALTRSIFPDDRIRADRMANGFSASARREPIALEPGVLLLHAHADSLAAPTLALGARAEGWPLAALSEPVRIMVILVSPENQGPEAHLEALTQIARAFKDRQLGAALLEGRL